MKASDILSRHKRFVRRSLGGTARITHDTYHTPVESWFDVRKRILARDGNQCRGVVRDLKGSPVRCSSVTNLEVHHMRPLSKGGRTIDANLITLCSKCHKRKHNHL